ncbi:MAG: thioredoxin [Natronomonas sp.]
MSDDTTIDEIRERKLEQLRESAQGGTQQQNRTEPVHIGSGAELDSLVADEDVVLADFYADWCGPCKMLEPIVQSIAETTSATVAKVDVDANQQLAAQYGVRGVPTMVLFAGGETAERLVGVQDESRLRQLIDRYAPA